MILTCKENAGDHALLVLPYDPEEKVSNQNFVASSEYITGVGYKLTVGRSYYVYGILAGPFGSRYLLAGDDGIPQYYPAELFEILDGNVSIDWQARQYSVAGTGMLLALGYPAAEDGYEAVRGLVDGDSVSIKNFMQHKDYVARWNL